MPRLTPTSRALHPHDRVFRGGDPYLRSAKLWVPILNAFAETHLIKSQHQKSSPGQCDPCILIRRVGLACVGVTRGPQNSRVGRSSGGGYIDVGCYIEIRLAFEDQLVDAIPISRKCAGDMGAQRCSGWKSPQQFNVLSAEIDLTSFNGSGRVEM